jgi:hypothetical protein
MAGKTAKELRMKYYHVRSWQNYRVTPPEGEDVLTEEQGDVIPENTNTSDSKYPDYEANAYFSTYEKARAKLEAIAAGYRQIGGSPRIVVRDDVKREHLFPK